jgi:hypothetical protein
MPGNQIPSNRPFWLAIIVLASVIIAAASGFALHLANATPADALGATFVAAMTLGIAVSRFLSG